MHAAPPVLARTTALLRQLAEREREAESRMDAGAVQLRHEVTLDAGNGVAGSTSARRALAVAEHQAPFLPPRTSAPFRGTASAFGSGAVEEQLAADEAAEAELGDDGDGGGDDGQVRLGKDRVLRRGADGREDYVLDPAVVEARRRARHTRHLARLVALRRAVGADLGFGGVRQLGGLWSEAEWAACKDFVPCGRCGSSACGKVLSPRQLMLRDAFAVGRLFGRHHADDDTMGEAEEAERDAELEATGGLEDAGRAEGDTASPARRPATTQDGRGHRTPRRRNVILPPTAVPRVAPRGSLGDAAGLGNVRVLHTVANHRELVQELDEELARLEGHLCEAAEERERQIAVMVEKAEALGLPVPGPGCQDGAEASPRGPPRGQILSTNRTSWQLLRASDVTTEDGHLKARLDPEALEPPARRRRNGRRIHWRDDVAFISSPRRPAAKANVAVVSSDVASALAAASKAMGQPVLKHRTVEVDMEDVPRANDFLFRQTSDENQLRPQAPADSSPARPSPRKDVSSVAAADVAELRRMKRRQMTSALQASLPQLVFPEHDRGGSSRAQMPSPRRPSPAVGGGFRR